MQNISKKKMEELYKNYKKTSDEEIKSLLSRITPVFETRRGKNKKTGLYEIDELTMAEVIKKPRSVIFTHYRNERFGKPRHDLKPFKKIVVMVKSSPLLEPNIGQVFDQITDEDKNVTRAVYLNVDSHTSTKGGNGKYTLAFFTEATLYK